MVGGTFLQAFANMGGHWSALGGDGLLTGRVRFRVRVKRMKGEHIVRDSLGVCRSSENFALVALQNIQPRADITGVVWDFRWNAQLDPDEGTRQLGSQLFNGISFVAKASAKISG